MSPDVVTPAALSRNDFVTVQRQRGRPRQYATDATRQQAKRARDKSMAQIVAAVLFPYFGGKADVAPVVWERFGTVRHYIEPFAGSAAVFLGCSQHRRHATLNDRNGHITNTLRSLKYAPRKVAWWADWAPNAIDLDARSGRLQASLPTLVERLRAEDRFYDAELAGLWIWMMSSRMQSRLGRGSHQLQVSTTGHGIHAGTKRDRLPAICEVMGARLKDGVILCGDWQMVLTETILRRAGQPVGIFLDPPYTMSRRDKALYAMDGDMADEVRGWAITHGEDPRLRIALCGLQDEHAMPAGWTAYHWRARGGMTNTKARGRQSGESRPEVVWFSPHCLQPAQLELMTHPGREIPSALGS